MPVYSNNQNKSLTVSRTGSYPRLNAQPSRFIELKIFFFILVHMPLAILFRQFDFLATGHALATFGLGLFFILNDKSPRRVNLLVAYIVGAELLWRSNGADVFYEFAKYATIFLLFFAIIKFNLLKNAAKWPFVYFMLLTPSILILPAFDREAISFNLAGPLALAVATIYFSSLSINVDELQRILVAVLAPVAGLGALVISGIVSAESIAFSAASNDQTSAGFGPNQVSSILGLGAMAAYLLFILFHNRKMLSRLLMLGISIWLFAQSALTFSRGGLWTGLGSIAVSGFFLMGSKRSKTAFSVFIILFFLIAQFFIFPLLNKFTGDTISERLESFNSTGRLQIAQGDLLAFSENPIFGVGPDQSRYYHGITYRIEAAHTEYTRMLSEHGLFGLCSLLILIGASIQNFFSKKRNNWQKAIILPFMFWALLYMIHAATRLSAFAFCFGLAFITLIEQPEIGGVSKNVPISK